MKRLLRTVKHLLKRLVRPLRLMHIDYQTKHSCSELERLYDLRDHLHQAEQREHFFQVQLEVRRQQIERGLA